MSEFKFMLAPIEYITGVAFRELCYRYGADLTFTPMARIDGLVRNNKPTLERIENTLGTPVVIQLIGANENKLRKYLDSFKPPEGFKGFNLNLGCSSPEIIKIGGGCALIKRISKTARMVGIVKEYGYSVSIKMRLGLNRRESEKGAYLNLIEGVDADLFIVHARDGVQDFGNPADPRVFKKCVDTGKTIIANGDIRSIKQVDKLKKVGVRGVMIGRAAVDDPTIFSKLKGENVVKKPGDLKQEFIDICKSVGTQQRYHENVLNIF